MLLLLGVCLLWPSVGAAQAAVPHPTAEEVAALAGKYFTVIEENRKVREDYTWQYRTEVWTDGVLQCVDLLNANLNDEGQPVYTQMNREQTVEQRRGIFSRGEQREKFEELDKTVAYVSDWLNYYSWMPLSRVTELFDQAARNHAVSLASSTGDLLRVEGRNIRDSDAGDFVSLYLHRETAYPVQLTFVVPVVTADKGGDDPKEESITATIYYRFLRNGEAFYADHVDVAVPSRNLKIKIESLNMIKKP